MSCSQAHPPTPSSTSVLTTPNSLTNNHLAALSSTMPHPTQKTPSMPLNASHSPQTKRFAGLPDNWRKAHTASQTQQHSITTRSRISRMIWDRASCQRARRRSSRKKRDKTSKNKAHLSWLHENQRNLKRWLSTLSWLVQRKNTHRNQNQSNSNLNRHSKKSTESYWNASL